MWKSSVFGSEIHTSRGFHDISSAIVVCFVLMASISFLNSQFSGRSCLSLSLLPCHAGTSTRPESLSLIAAGLSGVTRASKNSIDVGIAFMILFLRPRMVCVLQRRRSHPFLNVESVS